MKYLCLPSHRTHDVPDDPNLPLENVPELSEEQRLGLRHRGAEARGEEHREAGHQEQRGVVHHEDLCQAT